MNYVANYLEQYKKLHSGEEGYIDNGVVKTPNNNLFTGANFVTKLLPYFDNWLEHTSSSVRILDYGCGKANHLHEPKINGKTFYQAYEGRIQTYYCYDPGFKKYSRAPSDSQKFDVIICADVMEHLPTEISIKQSLRTMSYMLEDDGVALFTISGNKAKKSFLDGTNLHTSLYSFDQWVEWLSYHFQDKAVMMIYDVEGKDVYWYSDTYPK